MALLGVIGGGDLEGDLRDAEKKKAAGITAYKIKVGIDTAANDAARTRAICKLLGPGLLISADANQGYTTEQAIDYVRAVKGCGLDFFEQPVVADDLAGMAAVAAAAPEIAIGADEGIHSLADIARHHERKAARGVSLKAIKLGGIRAVVEAGKLCDSLGMSVNISCKTGESSIACAAALHVASVIPNIAWGLTLTHSGLAEDVTAQPIRTDKGHADSIERPGLGIDVDEDRVRRNRYQFAPRTWPDAIAFSVLIIAGRRIRLAGLYWSDLAYSRASENWRRKLSPRIDSKSVFRGFFFYYGAVPGAQLA